MFDEGWLFFASENNGCVISNNNMFVALVSTSELARANATGKKIYLSAV